METVGILGGGQLGRMLVEAAARLNIRTHILDPSSTSPAKQISSSVHIDGAFTDADTILRLASQCDVVTVEIEHVNVSALAAVVALDKARVCPSPEVIATIQDKLVQHEHLARHGVPVADHLAVDGDNVAPAARALGYPFFLKARTLAYDGRGNAVVLSPEDVDRAVASLGGRPLYAERFTTFDREVAVMVVRSASGDIATYPAVETVQRDSICHTVFVPLRSDVPDVQTRAQAVAERAVRSLGDGAVGVFGVELFLLSSNGTEFLVNEIAPRPHNSGHYTIEACMTSQYENHLRAILGLPLGSTALKVAAAAMLNLLGGGPTSVDATVRASLAIEGATVHLYGKGEERERKGRKMGHITLVGDSDADVRLRLARLVGGPIPDGSGTLSHPNPLVSVIMGSDSDLLVMRAGADVLRSFGVPFELTIVSAHRTPALMARFAASARERGLHVVIAGAGGAAHLPGMVAAMTTLPVIGVPVKGNSTDGVDALYSIVQMPRGIPVATVAINNATNAALLAIRILATTMPAYRNALEDYARKMDGEVEAKRAALSDVGWVDYKSP